METSNLFETRIYKLSTGENVGSSELGKSIADACHYIKYIVIGEDDNKNSIALIFPNKTLLEHPDYKLTPEDGCFCPRSLEELGKCLSGCLKRANQQIKDKSACIKSAALISSDLPVRSGIKSSSLAIIEKYKTMLMAKHGKNVPVNEEIYLIKNEY